MEAPACEEPAEQAAPPHLGAAGPLATTAAAAVRRTGYEGFGSFHSGNVEDLISVPRALYEPPPLPFPLDRLALGVNGEMLLGGEAARALFKIAFGEWTFLNHGAFGAVCVPAFREADLWREHCERQPLRFLDRELFPQVVRVMREVADFVHAQPQDLVLLPNATTGLNVVIGSALAAGDVVYMLDLGYASVRKMAAAVGAQVVLGEVEFPLSGPQAILDLVSRTLPSDCRLAVFDAVTSNTALVLPIADLVKLCHDRGVPVLIDAAHAMLQLEVDLGALGADYWVANCHKWLAAPRGTAVLWVAPHRQASVRPLVVSHGSGAGFVSDFIWDGCRDYAGVLGISSALHLWHALGPARVREHMRAVRVASAALLCERWGTEPLAPESMSAAMALVRLPSQLSEGAVSTSEDAKYIQDVLHYGHHIEVPVKCINGRLYVRISAHIYNQPQDYVKLADAVSAMPPAGQKGT